jgi:SAM-dependent methyltransferase
VACTTPPPDASTMSTNKLDKTPADLSNVADIYWRVVEERAQFPGAPLIRISPDWRERKTPSGAAARLFVEHLAAAQTVLDVGAGDRYWSEVLLRIGIDAEYRSADLETRHHHDYGDFLMVEDRVDAILMLELIEHLPLELGLRFIEHAVELLNPGGVLVIGTPNAHHPHWVWSTCMTHVRPWPVQDLWATCRLAGLADVSIYRQMLVTPRRRPIVPIQLALSKLMGIDAAQGIMLFGHKPRSL